MKFLDNWIAGQLERYKEKTSAVLDVATPGYDTPVPHPEQYDDYSQAYGKESWVYVCVNRVATATAALPLKLYYKTEDGERLRVLGHPQGRLWCERPNPYMTKFLFWQTNVSYLELNGNAYTERVYANERQMHRRNYRELYPIHPSYMGIVADPKKFIKHYEYRNPNGKGVPKILLPPQIKHIRYFSPVSDYYGASPMAAASTATALDLYSQAHVQNFFKNGARPSVVFTTDQRLDAPDIRRIKAQIRKNHQGSSNAWLPIVLYNGLKAFEFSMTNKDAEFVSQRKLSREEITAVFGVPPAMGGIYEYANYANTYAQKDIFYRDKIRPTCQLIESDLDGELDGDNAALQQGNMSFEVVRKHSKTGLPVAGKLVPARDKAEYQGGNLYFEFDMNDVLKAEPSVRFQGYALALENGWMTQNQVAQLENLPQVPWGDTWYLPLNKVPVEMFDGNLPDEEKVRRLSTYLNATEKMRKMLNYALEQSEVAVPEGEEAPEGAAEEGETQE